MNDRLFLLVSMLGWGSTVFLLSRLTKLREEETVEDVKRREWRSSLMPGERISAIELYGDRPTDCYCGNPNCPDAPCLACLREGFQTKNPAVFGLRGKAA